jgi:hypothetical protein
MALSSWNMNINIKKTLSHSGLRCGKDHDKSWFLPFAELRFFHGYWQVF